MVDARSNPAWRTARWGPLAVCALAYALALAAAAAVATLAAGWHPIATAFAADVAATFAVFAAGRVVNNSSVYDPYWSVAPPVIVLFWMAQEHGGGAVTAREALILFVVVVWAARLTFNCFRRWRDMRQEDFRYVDLRKSSGKLYPLVDLFGIQLLPTVLVFLGCLALYPATVSAAPLGLFDILAATVALSAVTIEAVADEQLVAFQKSNTDRNKVCDAGLWRWSQHPNYFGEIMFWWGLWVFALAADPAWWWTIVGPLSMTALFAFISIPMMLKRKRVRRPDYDAQVKGVSVLVPWPPGRV